MSVRGQLSRLEDVVVEQGGVSWDQEVTRLLLKNEGRAVHFKDINGREAVGNLYSSRESVASALNIGKEDIAAKLIEAIGSPCPVREIKNPDFRANVTDTFDLRDLPIPKYYPKDGGRYITAGIIISEYQGKRNVSFHRMMVLDDKRLAVRLVPRHLFTLHKLAKEAGEELRIAICVGVCPSILLSAATSLDFGQDELEVASALRTACLGEPVEVARTDSGLMVPAHADYVLEGRLTMDEVDEGPFVDITGTYDHVRRQPVIEVDRMYTRHDPIFHLVLPGGREHYLLMGLPREPMIFRTVRQVVPRTHAVRLTEGGCCWLHGIVSITKNKEGDGVNAIMAAFSGHPSMKRVIVVDDDVDIFNDQEVEWAVATRFQSKGLLVIENAAGSSLDPSSDGTTSKIGMDATKPIGSKLFEKARLTTSPSSGRSSPRDPFRC
jgi:UbiD family decarboxylase